jgi:hypothetical protein
VNPLSSAATASRIKAHPVLGKIKIGYDPVEPLATDEWPEAAR